MKKNSDIKILVVDDEEDFLEPITYWLEEQEYQVQKALSGAEMLGLVQMQDFDVVFLDINMKPMDGFDCLKELKRIKPDISVIMLTAQHTPIREGMARDLGADGFFYKGQDYSETTRAIELVMAGKKSLD